jgi:chromosomal replication initiator protein
LSLNCVCISVEKCAAISFENQHISATVIYESYNNFSNLFNTLVTDTIWPEFLHIVREEVGSRVVETWFKAIMFCRWDAPHKTVYLKAPNTFVKEWVTSHYAQLFERHLSRLLNEQTVRVLFIEPNIESHAETTTSNKTGVSSQLVPTKASVQSITIKPAVHSSLRPVIKNRGSMNSQYQFSNFVVGPHNSLAYAAAYAITEKPGRLYNPFFIYGDSGLGKTHLLHAIGNEMKNQHKNLRLLYQSADRFVNEFISAIRFNKVYQFEAKYKDVDLLLIDDIQFLSNKEQTQEAFFHIFNTLHQAQKQIVFTSDSLPRDIAGLAHRMRSRLESGLVTDISQPTLETKIAIIKKKAETNNEPITDDVAEYIASSVISNVRELEGALIRVFAFASLTKQPLTLELVQKVLVHNRESAKTTAIDLQKIGSTVAHYFDYSFNDIKSPKRDKDLTSARHIAIYFMKQYTQHSLREIGKFLDRKDHSSVIHALEKVEERKKKDPQFAHLLNRVERQITQ